jgi:hypothetical protein
VFREIFLQNPLGFRASAHPAKSRLDTTRSIRVEVDAARVVQVLVQPSLFCGNLSFRRENFKDFWVELPMKVEDALHVGVGVVP